MCKNKETLNRRVQGYLKPKNHALFDGFIKKNNDMSESAAINMMVSNFFARMPEKDRIEFLSIARTDRQ